MTDMSTRDAAERLGVSQRQVQRLAKAGSLSTIRVVGNALVVDPLSVNARRRALLGRGRPWSPAVAWGGLWLLSGLDAPWLTYSQRHRLDTRLGQISVLAFTAAVRERASVARYRVGDSAITETMRELGLTGASTTDTTAGFAGTTRSVDGYCASAKAAELVSRFAMVPDSRGSATLRIPAFAELPIPSGDMPHAVVAVDLAGSSESRERDAGLRLLNALLS